MCLVCVFLCAPPAASAKRKEVDQSKKENICFTKESHSVVKIFSSKKKKWIKCEYSDLQPLPGRNCVTAFVGRVGCRAVGCFLARQCQLENKHRIIFIFIYLCLLYFCPLWYVRNTFCAIFFRCRKNVNGLSVIARRAMIRCMQQKCVVGVLVGTSSESAPHAGRLRLIDFEGGGRGGGEATRAECVRRSSAGLDWKPYTQHHAPTHNTADRAVLWLFPENYTRRPRCNISLEFHDSALIIRHLLWSKNVRLNITRTKLMMMV